ncbi:hypothetical protein [uncultured Gimesia sp.]|uniref:hypothetical protein n=1 Tax=uncultured Gimesia sp. TaxID=1678688 RepID=UPI0030D9D5B2
MTTAIHRSPKLLDELRNQLRVMHYVWKTGQAYVMSIERFCFHRECNQGRMSCEQSLSRRIGKLPVLNAIAGKIEVAWVKSIG